jgi:hypothetical protein
VKLGVTALVGNYAKKNMKSSNWKKKLIGAALIYLAPIALRMVRKNWKNIRKIKVFPVWNNLYKLKKKRFLLLILILEMLSFFQYNISNTIL